MFETWMKHAHPGLPRASAYTIGWLAGVLVLAVATVIVVGKHSVLFCAYIAREVVEAWADPLQHLWRQRTTLDSDPWQEVRP